MSDFQPLPTGVYTISPANGDSGPVPGGMYVTGVGRGMPVIASAQRPQFAYQKWHVIHDTEKNQYSIMFVELDMSEKGGFSWDGRIHPRSRLVLEKSQQVLISPIKEDGNVYIIRPFSPTPAVDICVGVDRYNQLDFVFVPVHAPIESRPLWRFTRLPVH